jgi:hypothetical protein
VFHSLLKQAKKRSQMTKTNQRFLTAAVVFCSSVAAQNPPATETGTYSSRTEEIQAAHKQNRLTLHPRKNQELKMF